MTFLLSTVGTASAHQSRDHGELVVSTSGATSTGHMMLSNEIVGIEQSAAWAQTMLAGACPLTAEGVAGETGGAPGSLVLQLAWDCKLDQVDLSALLQAAQMDSLVVEFDGNTVVATAATPVVDAYGVHEPAPIGALELPPQSLLILALGLGVALVVILARRKVPADSESGSGRPRPARTGKFRVATSGGLAVALIAPLLVLAPTAATAAPESPAATESAAASESVDSPAAIEAPNPPHPARTPPPPPLRLPQLLQLPKPLPSPPG